MNNLRGQLGTTVWRAEDRMYVFQTGLVQSGLYITLDAKLHRYLSSHIESQLDTQLRNHVKATQ